MGSKTYEFMHFSKLTNMKKIQKGDKYINCHFSRLQFDEDFDDVLLLNCKFNECKFKGNFNNSTLDKSKFTKCEFIVGDYTKKDNFIEESIIRECVFNKSLIRNFTFKNSSIVSNIFKNFILNHNNIENSTLDGNIFNNVSFSINYTNSVVFSENTFNLLDFNSNVFDDTIFADCEFDNTKFSFNQLNNISIQRCNNLLGTVFKDNLINGGSFSSSTSTNSTNSINSINSTKYVNNKYNTVIYKLYKVIELNKQFKYCSRHELENALYKKLYNILLEDNKLNNFKNNSDSINSILKIALISFLTPYLIDETIINEFIESSTFKKIKKADNIIDTLEYIYNQNKHIISSLGS